MASIFNVVIDGVEYNFDDLFDIDVVGDGPSAPWLEDIAGVPVRYASIVYGERGPDTGWEDAGVDVAALWAKKGTASYVNANALPAQVRHYNVNSSAPVTATASVTFQRDGSVSLFPLDCGPRNWKTNPSATSGDDYDIRFTLQGSSNTAGVLSGTTLSQWFQINQARGLSLSITRNQTGAGLAIRDVLVELRRRSDLAVVYSFIVRIEAEADIS